MNRQRVHAAGKLARECRVDHAMAFEPALSAKGLRHDIETEMGLATWPMSGMAFMAMRFVLDVKAGGRESLAQLFRDQIACLHGRDIASVRCGSMPTFRVLSSVKS